MSHFIRDILVGQRSLVSKLYRSIDQDHFSHAVLFEGRAGYGILPLALTISAYLVCKNRKSEGPCGECSSCHKTSQFIHPDIHFAFPVVSKKELKRKDTTSKDYLKEWRLALNQNLYMSISEWIETIASSSAKADINVAECNEIIRQLSLQSFEEGSKVQIIWMAEYLGNNGNRLLKLIEEPPPNTYIFLLCESADNVLNTIKSRCRMISVPRIDSASLKAYLQSSTQLTDARIDEIAFLSEGDLSVALGHLDSDDASMMSVVLSLLDICYKMDVVAMRDWVETFNAYNAQQQKSVLNYMLQLLRELLHAGLLGDNHLRLSADEIRLVHQRPYLMSLQLSQIEHLSGILSDTIFHLERNVHVKTLMYNSCLQIESALHSGVYK